MQNQGEIKTTVKYPRGRLLIITLLMEGAALLIALLLAQYFNINLLPLTDSPLQDILIGTAAAVPPFILFLFTLSEKAENIPIFGSLKKTTMTDLKTLFSNAGLFDLVLISLLAGFAEEILFRGVFQAKFGIVAASVVFGLMHCVSPAYMVATTLMGFYIGAIYYASESLLVPVQIHFVYDLAALIYIKYFVPESGDSHKA